MVAYRGDGPFISENKNGKDLEFKIKCVHQIYRHPNIKFANGKGCGNCYECATNHSENGYCSGYSPIRLWTFEVKEKEKIA